MQRRDAGPAIEPTRQTGEPQMDDEEEILGDTEDADDEDGLP